MSRGETFPNLHGQLDVTGLAFQILDAPSSFSVHFIYALQSCYLLSDGLDCPLSSTFQCTLMCKVSISGRRLVVL